MAKQKDADLKQVMAEESSRGRRHPLKAENLENERRIRRIGEKLSDKACEKRDYLNVLRDCGLQDESEEFQQCVKLWDDLRGKS